MYLKLSLRVLNLDFCPLHPTSTYICGVNIMPRVRSGKKDCYLFKVL